AAHRAVLLRDAQRRGSAGPAGQPVRTQAAYLHKGVIAGSARQARPLAGQLGNNGSSRSTPATVITFRRSVVSLCRGLLPGVLGVSGRCCLLLSDDNDDHSM